MIFQLNFLSTAKIDRIMIFLKIEKKEQTVPVRVKTYPG